MDEAPSRSTDKLSSRLLPLLLFISLFFSHFVHAADPTVDGKRASNEVPASIDSSSVPTANTEIDLWQRLRSGMVMPELDTPLVGNQENWFLNRPAYLETAFRRARPYLYHVVEEVEARGMPAEIALLPVVESAYNPHAMSPAKASGI